MRAAIVDDVLIVTGAAAFLSGCWLLHPIVFCLVTGSVLVAMGLRRAKR